VLVKAPKAKKKLVVKIGTVRTLSEKELQSAVGAGAQFDDKSVPPPTHNY
jgi:hypothetical protein